MQISKAENLHLVTVKKKQVQRVRFFVMASVSLDVRFISSAVLTAKNFKCHWFPWGPGGRLIASDPLKILCQKHKITEFSTAAGLMAVNRGDSTRNRNQSPYNG
jgi:hypothetical protein